MGIETIFSFGPVWQAVSCFLKGLQNLFQGFRALWSKSKRDEMRVCKGECDLTAPQERACDKPQNKIQVMAYDQDTSQFDKLVTRYPERCVATNPAKGQKGLCLNCKGPGSACRYDTDCVSGWCMNNRLGLKDGTCSDIDLPPGVPCNGDAECAGTSSCRRAAMSRGSACSAAPEDVEQRCPEGSPAAVAGCPCSRDAECRSNYCIGGFGLGGIMKLGVCALSESPVLDSCKKAKNCAECVGARARGKLGIHHCVWSVGKAKRTYEQWEGMEAGYVWRAKEGCVAQKKSRSWSKNRWVDFMHRQQCARTLKEVRVADPCAATPAPTGCRCKSHAACASGMCEGKSIISTGKCAENEVAECAKHSVSRLTAGSKSACKKKRKACVAAGCEMDACSRFSPRKCSPKSQTV